MEDDWTLIYSVNQPYRAELIKQAIENDSIECVVLNKHDSITEAFGSVEIYVNIADKEKALEIIEKLEF